MHTSQLRYEHFAVQIDAADASVECLFPRWHKHQRFGIVIQEPLGAVGASCLIQAWIAGFFKHLPDSWGHLAGTALPGPAMPGTYPEVYAFHVGRRHGALGMVDIHPGYKEITVEADPVSVLHAINGRAITTLAVPEGDEKEPHWIWPELRAFLWRTESVFAYDATGQVADADVSIEALDAMPKGIVAGMLDPQERVKPLRNFNEDRTRVEAFGMVFEGSEFDDTVRYLADIDMRQYEVSAAERAAAFAARDRLTTTDGRAVETYRRRDAGYALRRLVP